MSTNLVVELLSDAEFNAKIESNNLTVVDFYAEWCGPCNRFSPTFDRIANDYPAVNFCKVNVDELEETAAKYNIRSIPCFHLFKKGSNIGSLTGASEDKLIKLIQQNL